MTPDNKKYQETLNDTSRVYAELISQLNKDALASYIARRKLILDIAERLLDAERGEEVLEKHLHNLIFQQNSELSKESDLWIINEEFIHFSGVSEKELAKIKIRDRYILKEDMTEEEKQYLVTEGKNDGNRRPDIFLYPEEGKCVIIEFKKPDVGISDYLHQIPRYASVIYNLAKEEFNIKEFYGYLIGENVDERAVRKVASEYQVQNRYNYSFLKWEQKTILGEFDKDDAKIDIEIHKYSELVKRAKLRNSIFEEKLGIKKN